jgi:putative transposase
MEELEPKHHKGWHSRGYLPHFDIPGEIQALTFRLADSVPRSVIDSWKMELSIGPDLPPKAAAELRRRITHYEDAGHGECLLREARHAAVVEDCLLHADGQQYRLMEWCIMPNHVHVMIGTFAGWPLGGIVRTWKTFSSRTIRGSLGMKGGLWALDYHDRYIRDQDHYQNARAYIRENPVKAGLCGSPGDWRWSSAFDGRAR